MAIYKLQHCYSLLSSPAEKLVCARLMQWRHRAEGDRRGKGCHGCHMNHSALTARLKRFLVVPVSPDRKNDDEPQSLRSMQIRWCNGFQFATISQARSKLLVLLAISCEQRTDVAPVAPWLPATARPDSTESSGAFWACSAITLAPRVAKRVHGL